MSQFSNNLHSVWSRCDETVQYVHQIFNPTGTELFKVVPKVSDLSKLDNSLCVFVVETSSYYRYQSGAWITIDTPVYSSTVSRECVLSQPVLPEKNTLIVEINGQRLLQSEYTTTLDSNGYIVSFKIVDEFDLTKSDIVFVKTYSNTTTPDSTGLYGVPMNLLNNPNNEDVDYIDASNFTQHFSDVVGSVITTGLVDDANDYERFFELNDKGQYKSSDIFGKQILQHECSLLPLMVSTSNPDLDIISAAIHSQSEYFRFKNKFNTKLVDLYTGDANWFKTTEITDIVDEVLTSINLGKGSEFAFYNNGIGATVEVPHPFIPATPNALGILPLYKPSIRNYMHVGKSFGLYNIDHTGAVSKSYETTANDAKLDLVFLELETRIYNSINDKFKDIDYKPALTTYDVLAEYSTEEFNTLRTRGLANWTSINKVDYSTNSYDSTNWKTWNYTGTKYVFSDATGGDHYFSGSWISVYMDVYGTWRPHTNPWEAFGITIKPTWWDIKFTPTKVQVGTGENDYTLVYDQPELWDAISTCEVEYNGKVYRVEPNISRFYGNPIVITGTGKIAPNGQEIKTVDIKSPIDLGVITESLSNQQSGWEVGDIGEVEFSYMNSPMYSFDVAMALYRAKPARFANYFFDTINYISKNNQYIRTGTNRRLVIDSTTQVHGENNLIVVGYQQWISEYLTYQHKDITTNYGDIVRGSAINVGTRLGGFTTTDNISFTSDSFGLIPSDNQILGMDKSSVIRDEVYSALTVTFVGTGYKISGYDLVEQRIPVLVPVKNGRKNTIEIVENRYVGKHLEYTNTVSYVKYKTIVKTVQEVFDIICGYGKYLESCGWIFEDMTESTEVINWDYVGKKFAVWAYNKPTKGEYINLNPTSTALKYKSSFGTVQNITQYSGGVWSLLDQDGNGIRHGEFDVARIGAIFMIRLNDNVDKSFNLVRLPIVSYEHAVVFDDKTIFGNTLYIPKYGAKHEMLKIYGTITDGWNGRLEANGFIVLEDNTIPNFEKLVTDMTKYYSNELIGNNDLESLSRHGIGFQTRDYLRELILDERSQLDFYRGFIAEKGTRQSLSKVLRASKTYNTENYKALEEWAFKIGDYGDINTKQHLQISINSEELKQNPQLFVYSADTNSHDVENYIYRIPGSNEVLNDTTQKFPMTAPLAKYQFPDIGPVVLDQVDVYGKDFDELDTQRLSYTEVHQVVPSIGWVFFDQNDKWDVVDIKDTGITVNSIRVVDKELYLAELELSSELVLPEKTLFFIVGDNDIIPTKLSKHMFYSSSYANATTYKVTLDISADITLSNAKIYVYQSVFDRISRENYIAASQKTYVPNIDAFDRPFLYNKTTYTTDCYLTKYDPSNGCFAGQITSELDYIGPFDPAIYNVFDESDIFWGKPYVGKTWWDTSTMFYVNSNVNVLTDPFNGNFEIDNNKTVEYLRNNLGKILSGTEINVYEWVESPVPPSEWDSYVNKTKGTDYSTSGEAVVTNWVAVDGYNSITKEYTKIYYFWVKNKVQYPEISGRKRSIAEVSRLISNPLELSTPWFALINENTFVVNGLNELVTDDKLVLDISYKTDNGEIKKHSQWQLCKEGLDYDVNPYIWKSLFNSLSATELVDDEEPRELLYPTNKLGCGSNKTWFKDIMGARRNFVDSINLIFQTINIASDTKKMDEIFNVTTKKQNPNGVKFKVVTENGQLVLKPSKKDVFVENDVVVVYSTDVLPDPLTESAVYYVHVTEQGNIRLMRNSSSNCAGTYITIEDKGSGVHTIITQKNFIMNLGNDLVMQDYWEPTDWYSVGISAVTPYTLEESLSAASLKDYTQGDLIKLVGNDGKWTLYQYIDTNGVMLWEAVGREKSTVKLNNLFYSDYNVYNSDGSISDRERNVRAAIRLLTNSLTNVQSRLLFDMVKYVHSEQTVVDWAFKTSYIFIVGLEQPLRLVYEQRVDLLEQIVKYFEEVKPYSTKIRSQIEQKTSDEDFISGVYNDLDPSAYDDTGNKLDSDIWDHEYATYDDYTDTWVATGSLPTGFKSPSRAFQSSTEVIHYDNVAVNDVNVDDLYSLEETNKIYSPFVEDNERPTSENYSKVFLSNKYKFKKPKFNSTTVLNSITHAKLGIIYEEVTTANNLFEAVNEYLKAHTDDLAATETFLKHLDECYSAAMNDMSQVSELNRYCKYNTLANRLKLYSGANDEQILDMIDYGFKGITFEDHIGTRTPVGYSALGTNDVFGYKLMSTDLYTKIYELCSVGGTTESDIYKKMMYEYGVYPWFVDYEDGGELSREAAFIYNTFVSRNSNFSFDTIMNSLTGDGCMFNPMIMLPRKYIKLVDGEGNTIEVPENEYINDYVEAVVNTGGYIDADYQSLNEIELDNSSMLYQDYSEVLGHFTGIAKDRAGYDADGYEANTKRVVFNASEFDKKYQDVTKPIVLDISDINNENEYFGKMWLSVGGYKVTVPQNTFESNSVFTGKLIHNPYNRNTLIPFIPLPDDLVNDIDGGLKATDFGICSVIKHIGTDATGLYVHVSDPSVFVTGHAFIVSNNNDVLVDNNGTIAINPPKVLLNGIGGIGDVYAPMLVGTNIVGNKVYLTGVPTDMVLSGNQIPEQTTSVGVLYCARQPDAGRTTDVYAETCQVDIFKYDNFYDTILEGVVDANDIYIDAEYVCAEYGINPTTGKTVHHGMYMPDYAKGGLSELVRSRVDENLQILSYEFDTTPVFDGSNWTYPVQLDSSNVFIPNADADVSIFHTDYNDSRYIHAPDAVKEIQLTNGELTTALDNGTKLLINGVFCTVYNNRLLSGQHYTRTFSDDISGTFTAFVLPENWVNNMLSQSAEYTDVTRASKVSSNNIVVIK